MPTPEEQDRIRTRAAERYADLLASGHIPERDPIKVRTYGWDGNGITDGEIISQTPLTVRTDEGVVTYALKADLFRVWEPG